MFVRVLLCGWRPSYEHEKMSLSTNDDIFKFLEFYQNESVIWNPRHIHHKDKKKVHDAWVRISNEMEIPIPELKKKKEALMATFRQHLKKKKASKTSGCGEEDVYKPIWVFYTIMESFLGDVYECSSKLNTTTRATEQSTSTDEQNYTKLGDDEEGQHSSSSNVTLPPPLNKTASKRRSSNPPELQKASEQMQHALKTINTVLTNKSAEKEDMCDLYGKLVASKLKKYFSDIEQQDVMFQLDELLTKRIRNSLQQRPSSSFSVMSSDGCTSPADMHRPSSSQTLYVLPDSPVHIPQRPFSSHSYPILQIPEQNNIITQNITVSSPQHEHYEQIQQPTLKQQKNNEIQILSDEVIKSAKFNPILHDAFLKAMSDNTP